MNQTPESLDIFNIHKNIIDEYSQFVESFIHIKDDEIREKIQSEISRGKFWPEPLIQFNPAFETGESVQSLCQKGILHQDLSNIFSGYQLFRHQVEALSIGCRLLLNHKIYAQELAAGKHQKGKKAKKETDSSGNLSLEL